MKKNIKFLSFILIFGMLSVLFLPSCSSQNTADKPTESTEFPSESFPSETAPMDETTDDTSESSLENESDNDSIPTPSPINGPYQRVVVIGVDGGGAFFKDAETPRLDEIFANGAVTYTALTANPSISAQCWGSLLHGVTPVKHRVTNSTTTPYPRTSQFPSIFRVIRENHPDVTLASFSGWKTINDAIIENGIDVHKVSGLSDVETTTQACNFIMQNDPTFLFVQYNMVDGVGHESGFGTQAHLKRINRTDEYIGKIYDAYADRGFLEDTLFIVTADHGGIGTDHGGMSDEEKYIMFAACGKTVAHGTIGDMEIRDTAAIVLYALGLECPSTWTARVPSGLFEGVTASERPVYGEITAHRKQESSPTPTKDSEGYITNYVDKPLRAYLPFDNSTDDVSGNSQTTQHETITYKDGYFGQAAVIDGEGYVTVEDHKPGTNSFSVAFWIDIGGVIADPAIFSNKDWESSDNIGYTFAILTYHTLRFTFCDGTNKFDSQTDLPTDYNEGWMHLALSVDRELNEVRVYIDFKEVKVIKIPASLQDASLDAFGHMNIANDGAGTDSIRLFASFDEFMIFDAALTQEDIAQLSVYYGIQN